MLHIALGILFLGLICARRPLTHRLAVLIQKGADKYVNPGLDSPSRIKRTISRTITLTLIGFLLFGFVLRAIWVWNWL
jgi:hypothetical protein